MTRRRLAVAIAFAALLAPAAPAAAQEWRSWPLPIPPGSKFETPSGIPGDLSFFAPNRGLMMVGGNNSVPEGLYSWDGVRWHQLATVCGAASNARIAWAGPDEFWTLARPSLPRQGPPGSALCHFKGGEVVGSYSAPTRSEDPYLSMFAAACNGPSDCWFAGVAGFDGSGARSGGFHLRWDGSRVQTVYAPQGRSVSDLLADDGRFFETTHVGGRPGGAADGAILRQPEDVPRLLHRITGGAFANDPFLPAALTGVPSEGTEMRALDSDGQTRWAVGGGSSLEGTQTPRPPLAARLDGADVWRELTLTGDPLPLDQTFGDVAAIPATGAAWVTMNNLSGGDGLGESPRIARIAPDGAVRIVDLPLPSGAVVGAATRVDCPAADDCWVATARGYLYRLAAAPASYDRDEDPAFQGTITQRPNEAAEQSIPDDPPQDDSLLLAPPVEIAAVPTAEELAAAEPCVLPKLVTRVRSKTRGQKRLQLVISFRLARQARIGMTARRGGKVVARATPRTLRRGNRSLTLKITRKRYPTKLSFVIRNDSGEADCAGSSATGTSVG